MRSLTHNLFYFILVGSRLFLNTLNGLASLFGSQAEDIHSSGKITRAETASRLRDATYQLSIGPVDLKRFQLLIILDLYFIREDTWLNIYFFVCWLQFVTYARFRNYRSRGALIGTIKWPLLGAEGYLLSDFSPYNSVEKQVMSSVPGYLDIPYNRSAPEKP